MSGCSEKPKSLTKNSKESRKAGLSVGDKCWNYYEQGRSFSDQGFYRDAVAEFKKAIDENDKDQWRLITTGTHFIDYFPHRELGIVYFQRQEFSKAIQELEYSVESAPSARGHYFLNQARAAIIDKNQLDNKPPELHLEGKTTLEITNKMFKTVIGVAQDDNYIAGIQVGGHQVGLELAERQKVFSHEVPLKEGINSIRVIATDLSGKSTEKALNIYSDRRGPQIEIEGLTAKGKNVIIKGNVTDNTGVASLIINNTTWPTANDAPGYAFTMLLPDKKITVVAQDRAGNVTSAVVRNSDFDMDKAGDSPLVLAPDSAESLTPDSRIESEPADKEPPSIKLQGIGSKLETYSEMILLEGMVSDSSLLIYITVNGEPILNRRGMRIYFSLLHKLNKGKNTFRIVAADEYGNKVIKTINIIRKLQNIHQLKSRMSVAIFPFEQKGEGSDSAQVAHEMTLNSFHEQARFRIIEPEKFDTVFHDRHISSTDLFNPDLSATLGNILPAQTILTGSIIETPDSIEIIGRLIDIQTASVLARHDIFSEGKGRDTLKNLLNGLAAKFNNDFPLAEGILLEVKDGEVLVDIGREKHIKPHSRLICYREGPPIIHPVTGRIVDSDPTILGNLEVVEVYEESSRAVILDHKLDMIASDKVIAQ